MALYFVAVIVIGNYVFLNLFLAILLDNFVGGGSDKSRDERKKAFKDREEEEKKDGEKDKDNKDKDKGNKDKEKRYLGALEELKHKGGHEHAEGCVDGDIAHVHNSSILPGSPQRHDPSLASPASSPSTPPQVTARKLLTVSLGSDPHAAFVPDPLSALDPTTPNPLSHNSENATSSHMARVATPYLVVDPESGPQVQHAQYEQHKKEGVSGMVGDVGSRVEGAVLEERSSSSSSLGHVPTMAKGDSLHRRNVSSSRRISRPGSAAALSQQDGTPVSSPKPLLPPPAPSSLLPPSTSLYLLSPSNPLRLACSRIVHHKAFEWSIILLILASSAVLAIDGPRVDPLSRMHHTLQVMDQVFVGLFALEAVLKIVTLGFVMHRDAYLRSPWNGLDFFLVVLGVMTLLIEKVGDGVTAGGLGSALRALRTLRALRPIRMASRAEGIKTIPGVGNVVLVCSLFYLVFAILGVNLFMGRFWGCEDVAGITTGTPGDLLVQNDLPGVSITKPWCTSTTSLPTVWDASGSNITLSTSWSNPIDNFDNVFNAMRTLFEVGTLSNWAIVMDSGIDATGEEIQPVRDHHVVMALYFVAFVIVGSFFALNLFVGVTVERFAAMKEKQEGRSVFLTTEQRNWVALQKLLVQLKPPRRTVDRNKSPVRHAALRLVESPPFDRLIALLVLLSIFIMSLHHVDQSPSWDKSLLYANAIFSYLFVLEALLKLFALSPMGYFQEQWNRFDFVVAAAACASVTLDLTGAGRKVGILSLLRILRVARIFRLIPRAKGLKALFQTLVFSLPALVNVGSVLLLFMFIYAVVGMNLFGTLPFGSSLNRHANFETGLAHGDAENRCTPSPLLAVMYFMSFQIFCAFMMLNLIIGVILDNFTNMTKKEEPLVATEHLEQFRKSWSELDPKATYYIPASKLPVLVERLAPPLGLGLASSNSSSSNGGASSPTSSSGNKKAVTALIMAVDIPDHHGRVHFLETLHALAGRVAATALPEQEEAALKGRIEGVLPADSAEVKYTAAHFNAAMYVQAAVRGFLTRHHLRTKCRALARLAYKATETDDGQDNPHQHSYDNNNNNNNNNSNNKGLREPLLLHGTPEDEEEHPPEDDTDGEHQVLR
eukprot:jgi/Chlat1/5611/Chrsp369S00415